MEKFLVELANTFSDFDFKNSDADAQAMAAIMRVTKRYPEFLPVTGRIRETEEEVLVEDTQKWLRAAWNAASLREREWYIFKAREAHYNATVLDWLRIAKMQADPARYPQRPPDSEIPEASNVPPFTAFEQALYHFHRIADRARHCANPECPAPYFFAAKKGQKYCSEKCAAPSQREQKRRWWREHRGGKQS